LASTGIGDYAVRVVGDTQHFEKSIDASIAASRKLVAAVKETDVAVKSASGGMKNGTFAIQQLALGVQDAASVFGTAGFSGAIRAAGNNVIQFASLLNPLAGTFAAFAITGVQLITDHFTKAGKAAVAAVEDFKNFRSEVDKNQKAADIRKEVGEVQKIGTSKGAREELEQMARDNENKKQQMEDNARSIDSQQAKIDTARARAVKFAKQQIRDEFGNITNEQIDRFLNKEERTTIGDAQREIGRLRESNLKLGEGQFGNVQKREALEKRRQDLKLFEDFDQSEKVQGGFALQELKKRNEQEKNAKDFEKSRQKAITEYNRDVFQEEEQQRRKNVSRNNFAGAASQGSAQATEAIARAQAVPNELVDIDKQALAIQQKALSELSEIRLNTKPVSHVIDVPCPCWGAAVIAIYIPSPVSLLTLETSLCVSTNWITFRICAAAIRRPASMKFRPRTNPPPRILWPPPTRCA